MIHIDDGVICAFVDTAASVQKRSSFHARFQISQVTSKIVFVLVCVSVCMRFTKTIRPQRSLIITPPPHFLQLKSNASSIMSVTVVQFKIYMH